MTAKTNEIFFAARRPCHRKTIANDIEFEKKIKILKTISRFYTGGFRTKFRKNRDDVTTDIIFF